MILADVNPLIYAFRPDSALHHVYRPWLQSVVEGEEPFAVAPQTLASLIRITTNAKIFVTPDSLEAAMAFSTALLRQPYCRIIHPGPRHWQIFSELCLRVKAKGNLVQDAWFAALAIEHGCEWITEDSDFSCFTGLRWRAISRQSIHRDRSIEPRAIDFPHCFR